MAWWPIVAEVGASLASSYMSSRAKQNAAEKAAKNYSGTEDGAISGINSATDQAQNYLAPYRMAGESSLPIYQHQLALMQDPTSYLNSILQQYQASAGFQNQTNAGLDAIRSSEESKGLLGSGAEARALDQYGIGRAQQGGQQYLQNILGIQGQEMGGLQNLIGGGQTAATQSGMFGMSGAEAIGNIIARIAAAQQGADQSSGDSSSGLFSNIGGGIMGGAMGSQGLLGKNVGTGGGILAGIASSKGSS